MEALVKIVGKTKIDRIRSQQIREWKQHVTKMDAERLVKIPRDNVLSEEDLQDPLKEVGAT